MRWWLCLPDRRPAHDVTNIGQVAWMRRQASAGKSTMRLPGRVAVAGGGDGARLWRVGWPRPRAAGDA